MDSIAFHNWHGRCGLCEFSIRRWAGGISEVLRSRIMVRQGFVSIAKTVSLGLIIVAVSLGTGCKKSPETPKPPTPPVQAPPAAKVTTDANKPAPQAANTTPTAPAAPAAPAGWVPLDLQLPKAVYSGTPQNLSEIPNLRPVTKEKRPPFLVPPGTKLLSLKKPVTSSETNPIIGEVSFITDGDKAGTDGSEVQLGTGKQDVTIDLEQLSEIHAIVVWHYHKQACVVYDVAVQVAKDKDFVTDVKTVFSNDTDNSLGLGVGKDQQYVESYEGELIDCVSKGSPKARYVKLYSKGCNFSELNYYIEVEVYGKPVE